MWWLHQLPRVNGVPTYSANATIKGLVNFALWQLFKMAGLTKVMRQKWILVLLVYLTKFLQEM